MLRENEELTYPEEIVAVLGKTTPTGAYLYLATRGDGKTFPILISRRKRYTWFHRWRNPTASGEVRTVHYFSTKEEAVSVPRWVPGRAKRLEPLAISYLGNVS